jgi:hypothetical protein
MPPQRNDARTGAHPPVQVLSVRVPPGARRVPVALATVAIGDVTFTCTIAREGRNRPVLRMRLPEVPADRSAGVVLPPALLAEVEAACVAAAKHDPEAANLLLR